MIAGKIQTHELAQIDQQRIDPDISHLLNKVQEGQQTLKTLANTNTAIWSDDFVKFQLFNCLSDHENQDCVGKLNSEVHIYNNIDPSQTANQAVKFKLYIGSRIILADNISVSDELINVSLHTGNLLHVRSNSLYRIIYVKFDDQKACNSLKDRTLCDELNEYVPINATTKRLPVKKVKITLSTKRK